MTGAPSELAMGLAGPIEGLLADPAPLIPFDMTFGAGGIVRDFTPRFTRRSGPMLPATGGILLTGRAGSEPSPFGLGKFLPDGRPDRSFGTSGHAQLEEPESPDRGPDLVAVMPGGRILVATRRKHDGITPRWSLVRLQSTGINDASFNGDGAVEVSLPGIGSDPLLAGLIVRQDGRVLLVGSGVRSTLVAVQFLANGQVDRSFGVEGRSQVTLPGGFARLHTATIDASGHVVVSGTTTRQDSGDDVLIARLRPDGRLDSSFGVHGSVVIDFGRGADFGARVVQLADGRVLVAASAQSGRTANRNQPVLARLHPDGELDASFGDGGLVRIETGKEPGNHLVSTLAVLSDGRAALAGHYLVDDIGVSAHPFSGTPQPFVTVVDPSGVPDRSFSGDGVVFFGDGLFSGNVRLAVEPSTEKLLVLLGRSAVRLNTAVPQIAALAMRIGGDPNPAGPGALHLHVLITNQSQAIRSGTVRLRASKKVAVVSSSHGTATVAPNMVDVLAKLRAIAPGQSATVILRTSVTGFEEGISLDGTLDTTDTNGKPITVRAAVMVSTSRFPTI